MKNGTAVQVRETPGPSDYGPYSSRADRAHYSSYSRAGAVTQTKIFMASSFYLAFIAASLALSRASGVIECPGGITLVDTFQIDGITWGACEDLQIPGGALSLVSSSQKEVEWFEKTYER